MAQHKKVFLLLFVHKKKSSPSLVGGVPIARCPQLALPSAVRDIIFGLMMRERRT
jgi:hypothetical protein